MFPSPLKTLFVSLSIAAAFASPTVANAGSIGYGVAPGTYYFSGTCLDCTPPSTNTPSPASAKLVVSDPYTASFEYHSDLYTDLRSSYVYSIQGETPTGSRSGRLLNIQFSTSTLPVGPIAFGGLDFGFALAPAPTSYGTFESRSDGQWSLTLTPNVYNVFTLTTFAEPNDIGNAGTWSTTAVPEPQTWALMLGGMALVGGIARRAKRT